MPDSSMPNAQTPSTIDGYAEVTGPCGDTMEVWVRVVGGTIVHVECGTSGCESSQRSVRAAANWATGRSLDDAAKVQQSDILAELNGLPPEWEHCALLAANTLRAAVASAQRALAASPARAGGKTPSMRRSQLEESET